MASSNRDSNLSHTDRLRLIVEYAREYGAKAVKAVRGQKLQESAAGAVDGDAVVHSDAQTEGMLNRKHEFETVSKRACDRSWDKVFVVLDGGTISCFKVQKHAKSDPPVRFRDENPFDLTGAVVCEACDYPKRPHVFRLRLAPCNEYLFQAKDDKEMQNWIDSISQVCGTV